MIWHLQWPCMRSEWLWPNFLITVLLSLHSVSNGDNNLLLPDTIAMRIKWISSVQFSLSVVSDSVTPWIAARQASLSITNSQSSPKPTSSRWCHPAIPSSVIPFSSRFNLSQHQGLFQWVSSSHQVAKILELQFSISPSKEYSGLTR